MTRKTAAAAGETAEFPAEPLLLAVGPVELSDAQRSRMRERVRALARDAAPPGTTTHRASPDAWQRLSPLIEMQVLRRDAAAGSQTVLLRVAAGGILPAHRHVAEEEFLVLEGECRVGTHRLGAGDMHVASAGSWHDDIATDGGVLILLRGEYPDPYERAAQR